MATFEERVQKRISDLAKAPFVEQKGWTEKTLIATLVKDRDTYSRPTTLVLVRINSCFTELMARLYLSGFYDGDDCLEYKAEIEKALKAKVKIILRREGDDMSDDDSDTSHPAVSVKDTDKKSCAKKDKSSIMKRAWEIAREAVKKFGGKVKEFFSASLKAAWAEV